MIKPLYYLRIALVSYEVLAIILLYVLFNLFSEHISSYLIGVEPNKEALKWIIAFPLGLVTWILKEGMSVLFPDEKTNKILHQWPEYWKLKAHFNIGLLYNLFFSAPCFYIWITNKLETPVGAWVFSTCTLAICINAFSFYTAKIQLKSTLIHLNS